MSKSDWGSQTNLCFLAHRCKAQALIYTPPRDTFVLLFRYFEPKTVWKKWANTIKEIRLLLKKILQNWDFCRDGSGLCCMYVVVATRNVFKCVRNSPLSNHKLFKAASVYPQNIFTAFFLLGLDRCMMSQSIAEHIHSKSTARKHLSKMYDCMLCSSPEQSDQSAVVIFWSHSVTNVTN